MLKKTTNELEGAQCQEFGRLAAGGAIGEGDQPIVVGNDARIADGDSEHIGGKVLDHSFDVVPDGLDVDDPVATPDARRNTQKLAGILHSFLELGLDEFRQRPRRDEEAGVGGLP